MNSDSLRRYALLSLAAIQLALPLWMIRDHLHLLDTGAEFRFHAQAVSSGSSISGKYIQLSFYADSFRTVEDSSWREGETVYLVIENDATGFGKIASVLRSPSNSIPSYLKTNVRLFLKPGNLIYFNFPFDKYFLEENKVREEKLQSLWRWTDAPPELTAIVRIHNGKALLSGLLVEGKPIEERFSQE